MSGTKRPLAGDALSPAAPAPAPAAPPTLPRATFAKLDPLPYLTSTLRSTGRRTNGRLPSEARPIHIHTGAMSHAHGSAVVRVGDTTALCGVRAEVLPVSHIANYRAGTYDPPPSRRRGDPEEAKDGSGPAEAQRPGGDDEDPNKQGQAQGQGEIRDYDLLVPNVELSTGCHPGFLPGQAPGTLAQTVSTRLYTLFHAGTGILEASQLRIWDDLLGGLPPQGGEDEAMGGTSDSDSDSDSQVDRQQQAAAPQVRAFWTLYVDVVFVSYDGNAFDAAVAASVAALRNTVLPAAWWDPDLECVVASRGPAGIAAATGRGPTKLDVRGLPIACSGVVLPAHVPDFGVLMDPDRLEEDLCSESVTVVVDGSAGDTQLVSISKGGGVRLGPAEIMEFVKVAEKRWKHVRDAMT